MYKCIVLMAIGLMTLIMLFAGNKAPVVTVDRKHGERAKDMMPAGSLALKVKTAVSGVATTGEDHADNKATDAGETLWPEYPPLAEDEVGEFSLVETEIDRYLQWGKMNPDATDQFRSAIFKLGDRGVAHYARKLLSLKNDDIKESSDAASVINHLDMIAYFAMVQRPIALDAVRTLAEREVVWSPSGDLQNGLKAVITFEAFDLLARMDPDTAAAHLKKVVDNHQDAYLTHYIYGRRLAGLSEDEIQKELRAKMDSPLVPHATKT